MNCQREETVDVELLTIEYESALSDAGTPPFAPLADGAGGGRGQEDTARVRARCERRARAAWFTTDTSCSSPLKWCHHTHTSSRKGTAPTPQGGRQQKAQRPSELAVCRHDCCVKCACRHTARRKVTRSLPHNTRVWRLINMLIKRGKQLALRGE